MPIIPLLGQKAYYDSGSIVSTMRAFSWDNKIPIRILPTGESKTLSQCPHSSLIPLTLYNSIMTASFQSFETLLSLQMFRIILCMMSSKWLPPYWKISAKMLSFRSAFTMYNLLTDAFISFKVGSFIDSSVILYWKWLSRLVHMLSRSKMSSSILLI